VQAAAGSVGVDLLLRIQATVLALPQAVRRSGACAVWVGGEESIEGRHHDESVGSDARPWRDAHGCAAGPCRQLPRGLPSTWPSSKLFLLSRKVASSRAHSSSPLKGVQPRVEGESAAAAARSSQVDDGDFASMPPGDVALAVQAAALRRVSARHAGLVVVAHAAPGPCADPGRQQVLCATEAALGHPDVAEVVLG